MIFRNTFRLLFSNFSNVWKLLLYYIICTALTAFVCGWFVVPVVRELADANVFKDLVDVIGNFFSNTPSSSAYTLQEISERVVDIFAVHVEFKAYTLFTIIWLVLVFPITLDLSSLALGEVLYGYMTSQVKYSFSGRFVKNLGKSLSYAIMRYALSIIINVLIVASFYGLLHFVVLGGLYILLSIVMLAVMIVLCALKHTIFSCWMPAMAVLDMDVFAALKMNTKTVVRKFFAIFSNMLLLEFMAIVVNLIFGVFTASVSLIVTLPLTIFVFEIARMVSFFFAHGMRFYVYPDMFISPKKFEEQDSIVRIKNLV